MSPGAVGGAQHGSTIQFSFQGMVLAARNRVLRLMRSDMTVLHSVGLADHRDIAGTSLVGMARQAQNLAILQRRFSAEPTRFFMIVMDLADIQPCSALLALAVCPIPCGSLDRCREFAAGHDNTPKRLSISAVLSGSLKTTPCSDPQANMNSIRSVISLMDRSDEDCPHGIKVF